MNSSANPVPARFSTFSGLWPFIRPYRAKVALAFVLLCLGSATLLLVPLAFRDLIDFGFGGKQAPANGGLADGLSLNGRFLALFALASLWAVTIAARYYTVSWVGERVAADLRSAVYRKVLAQSPQFFETLQTGEVLSRLTGDTTLIQTVVGSSVSMGLRSLFQFIGGMAMLAVTSFHLFSLILGLIALLMLPLMAMGRYVKKLSRESQDKIADASALAGEILNAVPTVQAYSQEVREAQRYAGRAEASFATAIRRSRFRALLTAFVIMAVMGAIIFVLWVGANQVNAGEMSGGQLASFVLYATLVSGGVSTIAEVWGDLMRASGAAGRLLELLRSEAAIVGGVEIFATADDQRIGVQFRDVEFRYPSRPEHAALAGIDLEISAGQSVALIGPSGAGKTTLFQLLLRFYDVTQGTILLNGVDIRRLALDELRRQIAVVPQEAVIFSSSALENIRYGRPDATDAEVVAAARSAHADEFIRRLPEAYQTFLGERGTRLSGGQRQRIAIARAILKNAPLLLLDEATSALDAESEILVQQGLAAAMQGRTTLIIAHRLATVKNVDRIVVLDQGRIVETGAAEDLRQQSGLYARLASLQFEMH
ncbi:ABC transporter [Methylomonas koyamae]|uniref:ABC transporter n=1 Tax=Methylomonas koyamae TaxID=702114 RepID=A0A177NUK9_9GAMM|nr:ABC transporter transmembrane domain-containing protein [Methylomonas koyamae]OAI20963.1 ABC transporter [Methylomonas koyamae]